MAKPSTVDEYCATFSGQAAARLDELRSLSRAAAPGAAEAVKWGHPAIVHAEGTILFAFSAHKNHANIAFTPSTREVFDEELAEYETGKGSIKLAYGEPIPADLLQRMIEFRINEFEQDGVKWM